MSKSLNAKVKSKLEQMKRMGSKGQVNGAGAAVIGLLIVVAVASMILMFTTAVNVQTFSAIAPIVANPGNANVSADVNSTIEAGFDATNTVAGFMSVIFLALMASIVIVIFLGFLVIGGRGQGGVSF